jgi:hypothetical protein
MPAPLVIWWAPARSADHVAPELIGCLLVKRQPSGEVLWAVIVRALRQAGVRWHH